MHKVMDVACEIVKLANRNNIPISNLKLQKILYFVQGYSFCVFNQPFFREDMEAWDFGPVVPIVYTNYQKYGANFLPDIRTYYDDSDSKFPIVAFNPYDFKTGENDFLIVVIKKLELYSITELSEIVRKQEPWKKAYSKNLNVIITKESIRKYFKEN